MKLNSKGTTKLYNRTWEWFNSTGEVRNEGFKYDQIEFEADDFVDWIRKFKKWRNTCERH